MIIVNGTVTITGAGTDNTLKKLDERNEGIIFKNCSSKNCTFKNKASGGCSDTDV